MSPHSEPIPVAIVADSRGNVRISQVMIVELPAYEIARLRLFGQLDCGKRQRISPLHIDQLPDAVINQLYAEERVSKDGDLLEFEGAEARREAEEAFAIIQRMAPGRYVAVAIDRSIPSM